MRATRPFVPPTALKYIEDLEQREVWLFGLIAEANDRLAHVRTYLGERALQEGSTQMELQGIREMAKIVHPVMMPNQIGQPPWRLPENQDLPITTDQLRQALFDAEREAKVSTK